MRLSANGLDFIKKHEGFIPYAYDDLVYPTEPYTGEKPLKGTLTIGYGHTANVYPNQTITKNEALALLAQDTQWAQDLVNNNLQVEVSQEQFDALVSHAFNTGRASETLYRLINTGASMLEIGLFWTTTYITSKGIELAGLIRRRAEEFAMFEKKKIIIGSSLVLLTGLSLGIYLYVKSKNKKAV